MADKLVPVCTDLGEKTLSSGTFAGSNDLKIGNYRICE